MTLFRPTGPSPSELPLLYFSPFAKECFKDVGDTVFVVGVLMIAAVIWKFRQAA